MPRWCALPGMWGCCARLEGFDDHHGSTASGARISAGRWLAGLVDDLGIVGLGHRRRHGEQLACPGEVGGAIAVGEQAAMAEVSGSD